MMKIKIEGITDFSNMMHEGALIDASEIHSIVAECAAPFVEKVKQGYASGGHMRTGKLIASIKLFKRGLRSNDPWFTYYIGPEYGNGGNAAHLLEYGTVERFVPALAKGGAGKKQGLSRSYGAKKSVGKVKQFGVLRRATDEYRSIGQKAMADKIIALISKKAKKRGLEVK